MEGYYVKCKFIIDKASSFYCQIGQTDLLYIQNVSFPLRDLKICCAKKYRLFAHSVSS